MSDGECRFQTIGHVAAGAMSSHCSVPFTDRVDSSSAAGLVDRSADLVGDSLLLVGAADRGEGRHLVEKRCDVGARTRRADHRARPAREHDQMESTALGWLPRKQWAVSLEMILDNV